MNKLQKILYFLLIYFRKEVNTTPFYNFFHPFSDKEGRGRWRQRAFPPLKKRISACNFAANDVK